MAIVVVFSAITIEYVKQHTVLIVGIISMVILTPYEMTLYKELDDTRVTWNVLEQVAQTLQANQVVLIRGEDMKFYYLPLSAMTEAVCMPYTENIEDDINGYVQTNPDVSTFLFETTFISSLFSIKGKHALKVCSSLKYAFLL